MSTPSPSFTLLQKPYFIKTFQNENYRDAFLRGQIFMNLSGYYHKIEGSDPQRGDYYDGRIPLNPAEIFINDVSLSEIVSVMPQASLGTIRDEYIPLFCCSMISDNILIEIESGIFRLHEKFKEVLQAFGQHSIVFHAGEFISNVQAACQNKELGLDYGPITYIDCVNPVLNSEHDKLYPSGINPLFTKDIKYSSQNEWRMCVASIENERDLLDGNDSFTLNIEPLTAVMKWTSAELAEAYFRITEQPEGIV